MEDQQGLLLPQGHQEEEEEEALTPTYRLSRRQRRRRRLLWGSGLALVVVLLATAYAAFAAWQVQQDLGRAEAAAAALERAIGADDVAAMETAAAEMRDASAAAADHTDGPLWSALSQAPFVGDDAAGVRALSRSLDVVADGGVPPLLDSLDRFEGVTVDGRVDVDLVRRLGEPVAESHAAFSEGADLVEDLDSSGFVGALRTRFETYVDFVTTTDRALGSARTATEVLPGLVGADGPRDYLLVFQNNAELRATGGLPGSWARVHAEDGLLTMEEQGAGGEFGERATPVLPLDPAERRLYGLQLGTYFRDANFTPDFPRAAELMAARWREDVGTAELDGVMSIDVVGMSYLLDGIGSVRAPGATLTAGNLVKTLLRTAYEVLPPSDQDAYFDAAARRIFDAAKGDLASPTRFVQGFDRAVGEGRFRMASFVEEEREALAGSRVLGALSGDDGPVPHVDVDLNDATGSKMSYYLRHSADVVATGCQDGVQTLAGTLDLRQTLPMAEAARLPDYVTGAGRYGVAPGSQLVLVRLHAPYGGEIANLRVAGRNVDDVAEIIDLAGRPAVTLTALVSGRTPVRIEWVMRTGPGQVGDTEVAVTPGLRGGGAFVAPAAC
ncbi:DUF4012 domain-containing protein [Nocardioides sp.]|uniref:DUF4012 domain-containing protein n=1 Tax=Nocardioides sp. TaxID=35761 RepID=UPI0027345A1D|nr:DUF4012 domain-containing protein [Nocardioides sp.]MDP3894675.1 DUF4012 domain-containing protein [Nocardioides sp.]